MMRVHVSFASLLALAACATAPAGTTNPAGDVTPAAPSQIALMLQRAGTADAPALPEVERLLGAADITRRDGAGAALTYRYEQCALMLLFAADARNTMRLAEAHPGPRRTGAAEPTLQQCAAEAEARTP